ncbi:SDR family NAD(P)-dependent oxidoreductase [Sediminivirga luteola]|uniref:SDR family NAD(P)-dependent oxidoreductase n=1 Tax=Sediminivirga luteola TaxID=1774748 RepID=UPI001F56926E|nr:SDR family oxidoreductase [Sediminivirga luteola]MCI2264504.1 SDR family oxidoreductase [Sediminivirga luteola]
MSTNDHAWLGLSGARIAVVGAAGAIGAAVSTALRAAGAHVHGLDREPRAPGDGLFASWDAIDLDDVDGAVAALRRLTGRIGAPDGLVIASGLYPARRFSEHPAAEVERLMRINALAPAALLNAYADALEAPDAAAAPDAPAAPAGGPGGSAVVTSSLAASRLKIGTAAYSASKAALDVLVQTLALERHVDGLRANIVAPGYVSAGSELNAIPGGYEEKLLSGALTPRLAVPDDLVDTYLWLLSPRSAWVNGAVVPVDGGNRLGTPESTAWLG